MPSRRWASARCIRLGKAFCQWTDGSQLARGELIQPSGTWLRDDSKGVFACVDGVRPVIMLVEAMED